MQNFGALRQEEEEEEKRKRLITKNSGLPKFAPPWRMKSQRVLNLNVEH